MKYSIFLLALLSTLPAYGSNREMPNGQVCSHGWVCIPPGHHKKKVAAHKHKAATPAVHTVCETKTEVVKVVVEKEIAITQKNHLRLLGGVGPGGITRSSTINTITLRQSFGAVVGLGYGRNVTERWSIEVAALTNQTGLLGVGYNW